MDKKVCYVCGKPINEHKLFYCVGPNSYVCGSRGCYDTYFWDRLAAKFVVDNKHEYVIANNNIYGIGQETDTPRGMSGSKHTIQFQDGTRVVTNSLWFISEIPQSKRHIFKTNEKII